MIMDKVNIGNSPPLPKNTRNFSVFSSLSVPVLQDPLEVEGDDVPDAADVGVVLAVVQQEHAVLAQGHRPVKQQL